MTVVGAPSDPSSAFDALTAFIAEPNTGLISTGMAARYGIQPGDSITLQPPGGRVQVKIVGLLETSDPASAQALDNLLLTDIATAQEIIGTPGTISHIDLILPPGYELTEDRGAAAARRSHHHAQPSQRRAGADDRRL